MTTHSFHQSLERSQRPEVELFWQKFYRQVFGPSLLFAKQVANDTPAQLLGQDRVIQLMSGQTIYVDEKLREKSYSDFLFEYVSNDRTNSPGWIEKALPIDYLAYAFFATREAYLFPWPILQQVWKARKADWLQRFPTTKAANPTYNSLFIAVPLVEVRKALSQGMKVEVAV